MFSQPVFTYDLSSNMNTMFPSSIGIIGYGDFGKFLHELVKKHLPEVEVKVFSRSNPVDNEVFYPLAEVCGSQVLFPTVPIKAFKETLEGIKDLLGENTIVCDVTSVKVHTVAAMRGVGIKNFIATHPMFGPYSYAKQNNSLAGLRIALCDGTLSASDEALLTQWLGSLGLKVLPMKADEHDKLVAETLFLTHLVGQTIKRGGFERTAVDTVSFGFLMDAVESVSHDEALFRDVYKYNPYCEEVLERFKAAEKDVEKFLKGAQ